MDWSCTSAPWPPAAQGCVSDHHDPNHEGLRGDSNRCPRKPATAEAADSRGAYWCRDRHAVLVGSPAPAKWAAGEANAQRVASPKLKQWCTANVRWKQPATAHTSKEKELDSTTIDNRRSKRAQHSQPLPLDHNSEPDLVTEQNTAAGNKSRREVPQRQAKTSSRNSAESLVRSYIN